MPIKDVEQRKAYDRQRHHGEYSRNPNLEYRKQKQRNYRAEVKLIVLSHYGSDGKLKCAWPDCEVVDIDMLTLDHVENNGAEHRRQGMHANRLYRKLIRDGFPEGFQTLCWNHQWKKELLRRREAHE